MKEKCLSYKGVTGFIDILGFGDKVLSVQDVDDIEEIVNSVKTVRKHFEHNSKDEVVQKGQKISNITTLAFSDSVVINIPLESDASSYSGEFDNIMAVITGFALNQAQCIFDGFFIRGGVDFGWWYHEKKDNILVSQSLTGAYKAESQAKYPVIVITDDFRNYFKNHPNTQFYGEQEEAFSRNFEKFMIKPKDGSSQDIYFLDYIGIVLDAIYDPESQEPWLVDHAKFIKQAFEKVTDQGVKDKYLWLCDYHNRKAKEFSNNPDCLCILHE